MLLLHILVVISDTGCSASERRSVFFVHGPKRTGQRDRLNCFDECDPNLWFYNYNTIMKPCTRFRPQIYYR